MRYDESMRNGEPSLYIEIHFCFSLVSAIREFSLPTSGCGCWHDTDMSYTELEMRLLSGG
jgi:hypothetical protein